MPGSVLNLPKVKRTTGLPVRGQSITARGASLARAGIAQNKSARMLRNRRDQIFLGIMTAMIAQRRFLVVGPFGSQAIRSKEPDALVSILRPGRFLRLQNEEIRRS